MPRNRRRWIIAALLALLLCGAAGGGLWWYCQRLPCATVKPAASPVEIKPTDPF
jgi:hypothetical protein